MSYVVFCTFDLKGANTQDYQNAYTDLATIGLKKVHKRSDGGEAVIPTTAAMGFFNGQSAAIVVTEVRNSVVAAFKARRLQSELFLTAGADGSWIPGAT